MSQVLSVFQVPRKPFSDNPLPINLNLWVNLRVEIRRLTHRTLLVYCNIAIILVILNRGIND